MDKNVTYVRAFKVGENNYSIGIRHAYSKGYTIELSGLNIDQAKYVVNNYKKNHSEFENIRVSNNIDSDIAIGKELNDIEGLMDEYMFIGDNSILQVVGFDTLSYTEDNNKYIQINYRVAVMYDNHNKNTFLIDEMNLFNWYLFGEY